MPGLGGLDSKQNGRKGGGQEEKAGKAQGEKQGQGESPAPIASKAPFRRGGKLLCARAAGLRLARDAPQALPNPTIPAGHDSPALPRGRKASAGAGGGTPQASGSVPYLPGPFFMCSPMKVALVMLMSVLAKIGRAHV